LSLNANIGLLSDPDKADRIFGITRGIEKEGLRIDPTGRLSMSEHPRCLGSALTHPNITTDFSEALLEFITEPSSSISDVMAQLSEIHQIAYQHLDQELLWASSMPCQLGEEESIPIGQYGSSNIGMMKTIYIFKYRDDENNISKRSWPPIWPSYANDSGHTL